MTPNPSSIPGPIQRNSWKLSVVATLEAWRLSTPNQPGIFPPNAVARTGREAIGEFWQGMLDLGVTDVMLETVEFQVTGESGWESGQAAVLAGDGSALDRLQYVVVWQQENGAWKWHRHLEQQPAA